MEQADEQQEEAKRLLEHYIDIIDNHKDSLIYYLSDCVTIDWFGKTVKTEKAIKSFLKETVSCVNHDFTNPSPVSKIGFRDTHIIKFPKEIKERIITPTDAIKDGEITPPKVSPTSSNSSQEEGQGDGLHNCEIASPTKRIRLDLGDCVISTPKVKYIRATGSVTFHKKSDKKFQRETKWSRPTTLEIAYSGTRATNFTIHLVIYQGNMRCRRNLLREFDAAADESD